MNRGSCSSPKMNSWSCSTPKTRHDVQRITLPGRVGAHSVVELKGLNVGHAIHLICDADVGELLFDELIFNQCKMAMELKS